MTSLHQATRALTNLLETGDEADRCYAARALGVFGDESVVDALIARLRDEDIDVCVDAAEALREIGSTKAVPSLIQSLENDSSGEICTVVATALGRLGGKEANDALLKVAAERPERLDWDDDWDTWWDVQLESIKALGRAKEVRSIDTLIDIMDNHEHQDIESDVLMVLAQLEDDGINALIQRLQEASTRSRRRAAKALGTVESVEASRALGQALKDSEAEVQIAAIHALAEQHAVTYLPVILLLMRDKDEGVRSAAIQCACQLASGAASAEEFQEQLLSLLNDPSSEVRSNSFNLLSKTIEKEGLLPEAITAVTASLNDPDPNVGANACMLLGKNGDISSIPNLVSLLGDGGRHPMLRREAAQALGKIGTLNDELMQALTEAISDQEQTVRLAALTALMELRACHSNTDEEATGKNPLEVVISALEGKIHTRSQEDEPDVAETVEPIEASLDEDIDDAVQPAAETSNVVELDTQVREKSDLTAEQELTLPSTPPRIAQPEQAAALSTLDAIAMDNVEAALNLNDEEAEPDKIDDEAIRYLDVAERQKKEAERMLVKRSFDVAIDVRQLAARVLADSDKEEAIVALIHVMQNESDEKTASEAIISLGEIAIKTPSLPGLMNALGPLIAQLAIGDRDRRLACARTLGRLRNRAAIAPLLSAVSDEIKDVRIEAIRSLSDLVMDGLDPIKEDHMVLEEVPTITIAEQFLASLEDSANGVRLAAAQGLSRLLELEALQELTETAVDKMLVAALQDGGQQTRPMGQVIRATDAAHGSEKLLAQLEKADDSSDRRFIIEMLEELFRPLPSRAAA